MSREQHEKEMPPKGEEKAKPDEDVAIAVQGIKLTSQNHSDRAARLSSLSEHYLKQFKRGGDLESIKHALSFANDAVKDDTCDDVAQTFELLYKRSRIAWMQYQETNQRQQLDEAIADADKALNMASNSIPKGYGSDVEGISPEFIQNLMAHLSTMLFNRYKLGGKIEDIEKAIGLARQVVEETDRASESSDLLEAISKAEASISSPAQSDTKLPSRQSRLGVMLLSEFYLTGREETLESGVEYSQRAFNAISKDDPTYIGILNDFVIMLTTKHTCTGDIQDIDRAISLAREAVNHKENAILLNNLGTALLSRYENTGTSKDLDEAISYIDKAIHATPKSHVDLPARFTNISKMYLRKYERTKAEVDLECAVSHAREAINKTPEGSHPTASRLSNLSKILSIKYERTSSWDTLKEAIDLGRKSVDLTPRGYVGPVDKKVKIVTSQKQEELATRSYYHPDLASRLSNLSSLLFRKHMRTGTVEDLDEAVLQLRRGLKLIPLTHADYATMLNNLGSLLLTRYGKLKTKKDLEDAVRAGEEAILKSREHHSNPNISGRLINMSHLIFARYLAKRESQDLEKAIIYAKDAIDDHPSNNDSERTNMQVYIGKLLWEKYLCKGPESNKYLDEAIQYTSEAIENEKKAASEPRDLPSHLGWLSTLFLERYKLADADQDLKEAVYHTREAVRRMAPDDKKHPIPKPLVRANSTSSSSLLQSTLALWQESPIGKQAGSEDLVACCENPNKMLPLQPKKDNHEECLNEPVDLPRKPLGATPDDYAELLGRWDLLIEQYKLIN
ncbi:hypothetical protein F4825DRAFT_476361 [Nemania diffusa]|nr:hypothetical protein F4825DRAFT_476361 [Nemania diffusa]